MSKLSTTDLPKIATKVREDIIKMLSTAGSGHPGGSLGIADVLVALYFGIMNHDPKKPGWEERDRLILSNGHVCPALYSVLARAGYFPISDLRHLRRLGSKLQGHPERLRLPGIETTSGPLGCGLAQACGIAYAARMDSKRFRTFCITSDGEHDEGNHWEAVLFAGKYKLSNLTLFVDRNNIQSDGFTTEIMPLDPLADKYRAFSWNVLEIDGHNFEEINGAVEKARAYYQGPTVVIAHTIPGKGVSFMENKWQWHAKPLTKEEARQALEDLR
jgi:transketolase